MNKEALEKMITLATSAFGLVAALAWNEAIKTLFQNIFGTASGIVSLFIYAIIITFIAVWVTSRLSKLLEKTKVKE
ncbi:hypothetical protein KKG41_00245 [Patescibacteria group bacterium]|nr:hypothetical protein [Patescibacteria group bacterium]MBU1890654.1 hypothetical protein [Patescibacteria group bacterium]